MTDMNVPTHKILNQVSKLLISLPSEFRYSHKLKLSKIHSILSELKRSIDIPIVPSVFSSTIPSRSIPNRKSLSPLKNEPFKVQSKADVDVDSILKTLQSDLIQDLRTSRIELMKGTREST